MDPPPDIAEAERKTHDIEQQLQAWNIDKAILLGWSGSAALARLVREGEGTQPVEIRLRGKSLGFEVSNDLGIAPW